MRAIHNFVMAMSINLTDTPINSKYSNNYLFFLHYLNQTHKIKQICLVT